MHTYFGSDREIYGTKLSLRKQTKLADNVCAQYTAISRKVGKSARDSPERHCGWFYVHCSVKKFEIIGTKGRGIVFASAKGRQQK